MFRKHARKTELNFGKVFVFIIELEIFCNYMEQRERIKKVINWLVFKGVVDGQNDLAARLGYSKSYMSQSLNGHENLSPKFVEKVCSFDSNLNFVWVLSGEGNMFLNNPFSEFSGVSGSPDPSSHSEVVVDASVWAVVKAQAESLAARDRQVDELISMLRSQIEDLKKVDAQTGGRAISADAV